MDECMSSIGEGKGIEGRYGGLPNPYGEADTSQIVILPIPFDKTSTYQQGSNKGPYAIIEASRNMELYDIETCSEVYLRGIYTAPPIQAQQSEEMIELGYQETKKWLQSKKFVITLGGEHTVSYAPIKAMSEKYNTLTILQFDAHADLHPAYENNRWSHASVMMRVKELPSVNSIVSIGIRSMSKEEVPFVNPNHTFFAHQLTESDEWIDNLMKVLHGYIYITFDLDAFDCSLMPSTGTPEPGGLFWDETLKILKRVFLEKEVVGFDVVELLPRTCNPAPDYLAAKLIYKMLSYKYSKG